MIEGSVSGFIPLTNGLGSGSRRRKNIHGSDGSGSATRVCDSGDGAAMPCFPAVFYVERIMVF